jgi:hypothetical protein
VPQQVVHLELKQDEVQAEQNDEWQPASNLPQPQERGGGGGDEEHKEHEQPSSGAGRATHGTQTKG